jgi:hypothetical protein
MRAQAFRKFVVTAAGLALVAFCSCERHSADELHGHGSGPGHDSGQGHGADQAEHMKSHATAEEMARDKDHGKEGRGDQQQMSTTALTPTPSPSPHH